MAIFVNNPSKKLVAKVIAICNINELPYGAVDTGNTIRIGKTPKYYLYFCSSGSFGIYTKDGYSMTPEKDVTDEMIYTALGLPPKKIAESPAGERIWVLKDKCSGQILEGYPTRDAARSQSGGGTRVVRGIFIED